MNPIAYRPAGRSPAPGPGCAPSPRVQNRNVELQGAATVVSKDVVTGPAALGADYKCTLESDIRLRRTADARYH